MRRLRLQIITFSLAALTMAVVDPVKPAFSQVPTPPPPVRLDGLFEADLADLRVTPGLTAAINNAHWGKPCYPPRATIKVVMKRGGDPIFLETIAGARADALKAKAQELGVADDQIKTEIAPGDSEYVLVSYGPFNTNDKEAPTVKYDWKPPKDSKVKKGDKIKVTIKASERYGDKDEDGHYHKSWPSGVQLLQLVLLDDYSNVLEVLDFKDYGKKPPECEVRTWEATYKVKHPPPVIILGVIVTDGAGNMTRPVAVTKEPLERAQLGASSKDAGDHSSGGHRRFETAEYFMGEGYSVIVEGWMHTHVKYPDPTRYGWKKPFEEDATLTWRTVYPEVGVRVEYDRGGIIYIGLEDRWHPIDTRGRPFEPNAADPQGTTKVTFEGQNPVCDVRTSFTIPAFINLHSGSSGSGKFGFSFSASDFAYKLGYLFSDHVRSAIKAGCRPPSRDAKGESIYLNSKPGVLPPVKRGLEERFTTADGLIWNLLTFGVIEGGGTVDFVLTSHDFPVTLLKDGKSFTLTTQKLVVDETLDGTLDLNTMTHKGGNIHHREGNITVKFIR
jgi:hypothetical protein